ncbi:serine/threonine-protein kinase HipA [Sphaerotilus hippei]|uniref:Serine/threonine-protein kinase HipA n=1 Tax=Sphaerotilus hippei TaxID=744406 RepID=A0A318H3I7_9BURK|nr:type II toxin-antitoxin system HipA family toxin [Sphaerotilus hippei]PXW97524.1 serine/threonine-protein kinase HipA [Sphaerotilus hippei]
MSVSLPAAALSVTTPEGPAGVLARDRQGYVFTCSAGASAAVGVSLTMPVRLRPYERAGLHPVFQMNLPEGFLLERLRHRLAKATAADPLLLLSVLGGENAVGRLRVAMPLAPSSTGMGPQQTETLSSLLAHRGAEGLFDRLVDRYLLRSGLSGVQPKVLVPTLIETPAADRSGESVSPASKASVLTRDLIVKSGLGEFPGLAINEFICMTMAARAGIEVPEFHLSDDRRLFVMQRFDRRGDGQLIGFEDMAVLAGRDASDKYKGSYEMVARLVQAFCAAQHRVESLRRLFDIVALSCLVGNGDAHLKNFGVLYDGVSDEMAGSVRLAPAFDIVNTTCYLPEDSLALELAGGRSLFASRQSLLDFAPACLLTPRQARARIVRLIEAAHDVMFEFDELAAEVPGFRSTLQRRLELFGQTFRAPAAGSGRS